jgi:ankyrin repeat protein
MLKTINENRGKVRLLISIVLVSLCCSLWVGATSLNNFLDSGDLLQYDANDNEYNLVVAAFKGDELLVESLLQRGINPNVTLDDGTSPLMSASQAGHIKICKILIESGADVNLNPVNSHTPIVSAVLGGQSMVINLLLEKGAVIDLADFTGKTPLMYAAAKADSNVVGRLLKANAKIDLKDKSGIDALMASIINNQLVNAQILIDAGANVNTSDKDGITPLMLITSKNNIILFDILQKKGAEINSVSKHGQSVLSIAIERNDEDLVEKIITRGADVNQKLTYSTKPLTIACYNKSNKFIVEQLQNKGAGTNKLPDFRQFTAGAITSFNSTDFMAGFELGVKEIKYKFDITGGMAFRLFAVPVLIHKSGNIYYQLWEKRHIAFLGIAKNFDLTHFGNHFIFGLNGGANGAYTYGTNKGVTMTVPNEFVFIPEVGGYLNNGFLQLNLKYQYTDFGTEGVSAGRVCLALKVLIGRSYKFNEKEYKPWE